MKSLRMLSFNCAVGRGLKNPVFLVTAGQSPGACDLIIIICHKTVLSAHCERDFWGPQRVTGCWGRRGDLGLCPAPGPPAPSHQHVLKAPSQRDQKCCRQQGVAVLHLSNGSGIS